MKDDLGGDVYAQKRFEGTKQATIVPLTFGRARIVLSLTDPRYYDDGW
jgi:hypothetical protein